MKKYWPALRDFALILAGTLTQAVALRIFFVPANLASGGVSGISQLIHHFTGWPIGLMVFLGNIPLFLLGWRFLGGPGFVLRTAFAIATYSFFADALLWLPFFPPRGITDDIVLNSLYGAVVAGFGYGLVYRGRGTSGGSDILARILVHYRGISMTQSYLMTDTLVILGAGFVFGWKEALYAVITLYVSGLVVDTTMEGGGTVRTALIITSKADEVAQRILTDMERGVTRLSATGGYTGQQRTVLYVVLSRSEVQILKDIVQSIDERAFMVVGAAHEALGEGFQPFQK
ncbi:MAG: YitT family protein [Anaerolineales bacterium]|nr:YitT family protein [Anaerolineales bacterium]MCX7754291.1 YitT family protein [Anaerolineales bacterium]MDW8278674.1 YitT family protein [Anaerolineales bacterium]